MCVSSSHQRWLRGSSSCSSSFSSSFFLPIFEEEDENEDECSDVLIAACCFNFKLT